MLSIPFRLWNCGERFAAFALLMLLLPLMVVIGAIIVVLSRRSPLVTHARVGRCGESFHMLKFRTMWGDHPNEEPPEVTKPFDDPRVSSRFARLCRRYSVDEIPQLVHVISGRMAIVGPRPLTRGELQRHYRSDAAEILTARPGLTGLWQVMGRSRLTYTQRRRLDLFLVRHPLIRLHAGILLRTIPQVISGRNSW
jgi:exopolysaccharide production protein ExoY